ncbi:MAG: DUF938 domain-containing protein [Pseudomonadota bacterium]
MTGPGGSGRAPDPLAASYRSSWGEMQADGRLSSPAAERNTAPIIEALRPFLGNRQGTALEIGSGTGQHSVALAAAFPTLAWQPSDPVERNRRSIAAWAGIAGGANLRPPIDLDATTDWRATPVLDAALPLAAVFAANVLHIAPWTVAEGIVAGAATGLAPGGYLLLYGPFREDGRHTSEGNERFDATLRAQDQAHGIRDLEAVTDLCAKAGFEPPGIERMPANNLLLAFARRAEGTRPHAVSPLS